MKNSLLVLVFTLGLLCSANAQKSDYWQQEVNYRIQVSLDDQLHELSGLAQIDYINHSPDTLRFIWIHLWPNAYKNDRTAFSDQFLENGRTDFYFSEPEQKGYINRLSFKVNGTMAVLKDHPEHQDIVQLILPQPLLPGLQMKIETPFHVKLPFNFSRGGHVGQTYQITQWYPKPAVYDRQGWHPMPYLDQGEFYSEFGKYQVSITLPSNYVVGATGMQTSETTADSPNETRTPAVAVSKTTKGKKPSQSTDIPSSATYKTLTFEQDQVHDFAWFASKSFQSKEEQLQLPSGRKISIKVLYEKGHDALWKQSTQFVQQAILTRSKWLGEYPYPVVTVVEAKMGLAGGMEYPTITSISPVTTETDLESVIEHEVGHNWNYGILASNERSFPWMDEGINTYFDLRYNQSHSNIAKPAAAPTFISKRLPDNELTLGLETMQALQLDQPIATSSEAFHATNYGVVAYQKTALWLQWLEQQLGQSVFDSCMHEYYRRWQFKHPYPADFQRVFEDVSGRKLDAEFALLQQTGKLPNQPKRKGTQWQSFFGFRNGKKKHTLFALPALGYNQYNQLMLGGILHNYTLAPEKFQFLLAPLYSTNLGDLNGLARFSYRFAGKGKIQSVVASLNVAHFATKESKDSLNNQVAENFSKVVPAFRFYFKHPSRSTLQTWIDVKSTLIFEKQFTDYASKTGSTDGIVYPTASATAFRYVSEISFNTNNSRVLYPYDYQVQFQHGSSFYRFNITGNYFFNYPKGGGLKARVFAAQFGFIGDNTSEAFRYQPKLLSGNGDDDYTYSEYFIGRSASGGNPDFPVANKGLGLQQLMIRNTGGLKFRLDQFSGVHGYSSKWVAAINLSTSIPEKIIPKVLPLSIFLDIGTYAEAWEKNASTGKFLYTSGLQLSLFKNALQIFAPILYSSDFSDQLSSVPDEDTFLKKLFFTIDLHQLSLRKIIPSLPL